MSQSNAVALSGDALLQTPLFSPHNQLFLLNDRDAICQHVSGIFKPHELKPRQPGESISASMHHLRRGRLSVNRLEYGTDVHIDPARLDSFYLIQIPLRGSAAIRCGQHQFDSTPRLASLISPQLPLSMCWQASAAQLAIRIDQDDMAYHCQQHLPRSRDRLPCFDPRLDFSRRLILLVPETAGSRWQLAVTALVVLRETAQMGKPPLEGHLCHRGLSIPQQFVVHLFHAQVTQ